MLKLYFVTFFILIWLQFNCSAMPTPDEERYFDKEVIIYLKLCFILHIYIWRNINNKSIKLILFSIFLYSILVILPVG